MALQTMASGKLISNVNIWDEERKKENSSKLNSWKQDSALSLEDKSIANIKITILK